ncbi:hypothetical protein GUJ93_ZPchr0008g13614 [Zizania palustris]|uniref:Uncharacterized protein n=1 Tax=Zizania palustris TaxID=103762 RepID=A0A8J5RGB6_ZIZPA|nr:hypothetical protein GUJ93_ZPchr0008g13614 [Zizania palustris]
MGTSQESIFSSASTVVQVNAYDVDLLPVYAKELTAGGFAGAFAKTAVAPLERVKILLQIYNLNSDVSLSDGRAGCSSICKASKLVTFHLSSISSLYVQDGAVGSSLECDAKINVISDNPSTVMLPSNVLWKISDYAISHDTCSLNIYVASSLNTNIRNILGPGTQYANEFAVVDIECSSLILCGKSFVDPTMLKGALSALIVPILSIRGGLPFPGWLLTFGGLVIMLFAPVEVIKSSKIQDVLVSTDSGVVVSSKGSNVLFPAKAREPILIAKPDTMIIIASNRGLRRRQTVRSR